MYIDGRHLTLDSLERQRREGVRGSGRRLLAASRWRTQRRGVRARQGAAYGDKRVDIRDICAIKFKL